MRAVLGELKEKKKVIVLFFDQFEEITTKQELAELFNQIRMLCAAVESADESLVLGFSWKTDGSIPTDHPAYHVWHSFSDRRREFVEAAIEWGVPVHLLITEAPSELVRTRLEQRTGDPSDADWTVYQAAAARWTPPDPMLCPFNKVDARRSPHEMLSDALRALAKVGLV